MDAKPTAPDVDSGAPAPIGISITKIIVRAVVILCGIVLGVILAEFIGLLVGWIEFMC